MPLAVPLAIPIARPIAMPSEPGTLPLRRPPLRDLPSTRFSCETLPLPGLRPGGDNQRACRLNFRPSTWA